MAYVQPSSKTLDFWGVLYSLDMRIDFEKLQHALDRAGISQAELARQLGVTRGTVSNWVRGQRVPQLGHLLETARILNMSISEIFGEEVLFAETEQEREVLQALRELSEPERKHLASFIVRLAPAKPESSE